MLFVLFVQSCLFTEYNGAPLLVVAQVRLRWCGRPCDHVSTQGECKWSSHSFLCPLQSLLPIQFSQFLYLTVVFGMPKHLHGMISDIDIPPLRAVPRTRDASDTLDGSPDTPHRATRLVMVVRFYRTCEFGCLGLSHLVGTLTYSRTAAYSWGCLPNQDTSLACVRRDKMYAVKQGRRR